jgi:hypothetical protein
MVLGEERLAHLSALRRSRTRQAFLDETLNSFRLTFRELRFELDAKNNAVNAQALVLRAGRIVRLYGGLAFHPKVGEQLLTFVLLHETGHHLSSGCRLPWDQRLACECASDHWAVTEGAGALRSSAGARLVVPSVIHQMDSFSQQHDRRLVLSSTERRGCWAFTLSARKRSIASKRRFRGTFCPLAEMVLASSRNCKRSRLGGNHGSLHRKSE